MRKKFKAERINTYMLFTNEFKEQFTKDDLDEDLTVRMRAELSNFIYTHMIGKETIMQEFKRPSFLDWLLRRKRHLRVEVKIKEMLKNPPNTDNIIYQIDY